MTALTTGSGRRRRVAIHETGHAVAALLVGVRVSRLTVRREDDRDGTCWHGPARSPIGQALILAGGIAAETEAFGGYDAPGAGQDVRQLRRLASETGDGLSPNGTVRRYLGLALGRLRENWRAVEAVAGALERQGTLQGQAVEAIARGAGLKLPGPGPQLIVDDSSVSTGDPERLLELVRDQPKGRARPVRVLPLDVGRFLA